MKKNITKILIVSILAVTLVFILTACGGLNNLFRNGGGSDNTQTDGGGTKGNDDNGGNKSDNEDKDAPPVFSFATDSWATIAAHSASGKANAVYSVGDEKIIELSTGEKVTLQILGFDHDELSDGTGKAGITIGLKHLLAATARMDSISWYTNGWGASLVRTVTLANIFPQLPQDLQPLIKTVSKNTMIGGGPSGGQVPIALQTHEDKLFLFSRVEIDGTTLDFYKDEGNQYEFWRTVRNGNVSSQRIKLLANGFGNATDWWLRTCNTAGAGAAATRISASGTFTDNTSPANFSGVSFGFCL